MRKGGSFFVASVLGLCLAFMIMFNIYLFDSLEYKESYAYIPHQQIITETLDNNESIKLINKLNNREFNIVYVENENFDGQVRFCAVFDNTIYINKAITSDTTRFVWTYAHESVHANFLCLDERKTQYLTFKLLYESGNEFFKQVALKQASMMINLSDKQYDATYYIAEYLKNKK